MRCIVAILAASLVAPCGAGAQRPSTAASPISAFAVQKARTLLHQQLPCLGCHALGDSGGRLAPDLATVRERRSPAYIAAMIDDPQRTAPGSLMPRTAMLPATRDVIVGYLQSLPGDATAADGLPPVASPPMVGAADGKTLYIRWCAACHGTTGRGDGPNAAFLPVKAAAHASAAAMGARSDDTLFDTIMGGGAIMNRSPRMPAFGETLSPTDVRALVQYIRTLCRCQGPAWSRDGSNRP